MKLFVWLPLFFILWLSNAFTCDCNQPTFYEVLEGYHHIFKGRLISTRLLTHKEIQSKPEGLNENDVEFTFQLSKSFKGDSSDEIKVLSNSYGGACGIVLNIGQFYLVYAEESQGEKVTGRCSPTKEIHFSKKDIQALESDDPQDFTPDTQDDLFYEMRRSNRSPFSCFMDLTLWAYLMVAFVTGGFVSYLISRRCCR